MQLFTEWLALLLRWGHVIAGIMWIGDSFLFMWMDSHLEPPEKPVEGVSGELWMVHGGGFYQLQKRPALPSGFMPKHLHWFMWESRLTFISGMFLIGVVYWLAGSPYLRDASVSSLTHWQAVGVGFGSLVLGWAFYDLLWSSPLGKRWQVGGAITLAFVVAMAFALSHLLSGRAAFLHVGAIIGTIMAANVQVRILPAQHALLAVARATTPVPESGPGSRAAALELGKRAKMRSTHNHYLTLPLLFMMLSNHFSTTYSGGRAWLVLGLMSVFGVAIKIAMNKKGETPKLVLGTGAASLVVVVFLTLPAGVFGKAPSGPPVSFAQAHSVIQARCIGCHSQKPIMPGIAAAPLGVAFDTPEQIKTYVERIKLRAVVLKTMPLGNGTGMTEDERVMLGSWIEQGAPLAP